MVWDVTQQLTVRIKLSMLFLTKFFKESKIPGVYARVSLAGYKTKFPWTKFPGKFCLDFWEILSEFREILSRYFLGC